MTRRGISELIWLLPPRGREKYICVLEAYLDESGIHDSASICVIAGFVGSVSEWKRFERSYLAIGDDARVTGFHSSEFFSNVTRAQGKYKDWGAQRNVRLIKGLVDSINLVKVFPFGAAVNVGDFLSYTKEERKFLTGAHTKGKTIILTGSPKQPYYVAFQSAIAQALARVDRPEWRVHFNFEQQTALAPYATTLYAKMKADPLNAEDSTRMGSILYSSSIERPALQAADALAYCWHQLLDRNVNESGQIGRLVRHILDSWVQRNRWLDYFNKTTMDRLLRRAPLREGRTFEV